MTLPDARSWAAVAAVAAVLVPLGGHGGFAEAASANEEFVIMDDEQGWFRVETRDVALHYSLAPFAVVDWSVDGATILESLAPAESRAFTVDRDTGVLRFGDGERGRAPPSSDGAAVTTYRTGAGGIGAVVDANWTAAFPHGTQVESLAPDADAAVARYRVTPPEAASAIVTVKGEHEWSALTLNFTREFHVRVR